MFTSAASNSLASIVQSNADNLQLVIDSNNITNTLSILKAGDLANRPLPNGQMPLHYAIRLGKLELVDACFKELKLQTQQKDAQGLTAVDHAIIGGDPKMVSLVLGHTIGQAFNAAVAKPLTIMHSIEIQKIMNDIEQLRSDAFFNSLPKLHEAARKGELEEVKKLLNPKDPNSYDPRGMTPLHYAVLAGKKEVVQWLLQNGAKADILTQSGRSLLHLAAIGGHTDLIPDLIEVHKLNPNVLDAKRMQPLHYAMTLEDLSIVKALILRGANPLLSDPTTAISCSPLEAMLALAKTRSNSRDPLVLSNLQVLMFAGIIAPWVSQVCGGNDPLLDEVLPVISSIAFFLTAYNSLKSRKSIAAFWGFTLVTSLAASALYTQIFYTGDTTGSRLVLGASLAMQAWQSYQVGKGVLQGLSNSWANRSLETYRPIRNAIVHSVIGLNVANDVVSTVKTSVERNNLLNAWEKHMEIEGDTFRNLGTDPQHGPEELQRQLFIDNFFNRYEQTKNRGEAPPQPEAAKCDFDPKICDDKTDIECILSLNPKCDNQAPIILSTSHESACKKASRILRVRYHPDKIISYIDNLPKEEREKIPPDIIDRIHTDNSIVYTQITDSAETMGCLYKS